MLKIYHREETLEFAEDPVIIPRLTFKWKKKSLIPRMVRETSHKAWGKLFGSSSRFFSSRVKPEFCRCEQGHEVSESDTAGFCVRRLSYK